MNPAESRGPTEDLGVQLLDNLAKMTRKMHDAIEAKSTTDMDRIGVDLVKAVLDVEARPMPSDPESRQKVRDILVLTEENLELAKAHQLGIAGLLEKVRLNHRGTSIK
jgi:Ethanolamine utilization protein EutJ (predicted chaperonin)